MRSAKVNLSSELAGLRLCLLCAYVYSFQPVSGTSFKTQQHFSGAVQRKIGIKVNEQ